LILALGLVLLAPSIPSAVAQGGAGTEPEGERERLIIDRFQTLLEKAPRRGTALDRVYGYHVERGTLDDLIKRYQDRTAGDPKDGAAWLLLGLFEAQRGQDAAAVAAFRRAETERPDDPLPAHYLGQALVLVGQPDAAAAAFERALTRNPARSDLLEIYQALGRVYGRAHRNEQALEVWTRLETLFPDDARVQEQIAATLAEESQFEPALVRYRALAKAARDPYRKVQFGIEAASLELRLGRSSAALGAFEALLAGLEPGSWLERDVRRRIEDVFLQNDDQTGLALYYEKWIAKTPDDVEAMARLGRCLAALGRAADARSWFDKALKLAPSRKELRLALIEQLGHDKKFAEAAAQYEILSQADPANPDLIRDWGRMLLKDGSVPEVKRKARAAAVWRRLIAARPKDPAIATQVADLLRQAEATDEAIALYRKAVELAPDSPHYREYLGEYYHALKRPDDALAAWRPMAAGPNRSAKSLARLTEVLAGFGYKDEAIATAAEACTLDPEALALRLKHADLLQAAGRPGAAGAELAIAARLAADDDERETVLERQIKNEQSGGQLGERIAALRTEIAAAGDSDRGRAAALWRRLARYLEVDQKLPEAIGAIERALALDERSVTGWAVAARLYEATGRLGDAAGVARRLAGLDPRARTDYLTRVARLEARLGRREEALKAGRDLLAAAPGNPEHAQFFADLCFQLGADDEGIETLRRSARANAADPQALLGLGDALAREFRTEEAIELYWRAFDRTNDLDGKLGLISKLTELYLQRNQFDRLVARLQRLRQEADRPREPALCLAQAYASSGDLPTARQEVEALLAASPRDTALLQQLSSLAESEGDLAEAAKYQQQLHEVAPSDESATRLAQLYLRSGAVTEAEALWSRLATDQQDGLRILQAVDNLLAHGKYDTVLEITERIIRKDPANWEALYRQGRALSALYRHGEAALRYQALLNLRVDDDEQGTISRARRKPPAGARVAGTPAGGAPVAIERFPERLRVLAARQIRMTLGLQSGYVSSQLASTPDDFGQARMAALGALFSESQRDGTQDDWLAARRAARDDAPNDPRLARDFYYVQLVRQDPPAIYEAARTLAGRTPEDPAALWAFLNALSSRALVSGSLGIVRLTPDTADTPTPLLAAELEEVVAAYRKLRARRSEWASGATVSSVIFELMRAGRDQDADALYRQEVASAVDAVSIATAALLAAERGDVDVLLGLFDAYQRLQAGPSRQGAATASPYALSSYGVSVVAPTASMARAMFRLADAKAYGDILRLLDRYLASLHDPARRKQAASARPGAGALATPAPINNQVVVWLSANPTSVPIDYPVPDAYLDAAAIQLLRNAFELYRRGDLLSDLLAHVRKPIVAAGAAEEQITAHLVLSALKWWSDDQAEALKELEAAVLLVPADAELRFKLAELRAQQQQPEEALAQLDAVEPVNQVTLERRELLALRLAVQAGDLERARQAAERLFGLRLDAATQIQLAAQMHQLGMHELAEAVLARARRRTGGNSSTLTSLMRQYQAQGKPDVAVQIALQIVRRGPTGPATAGIVTRVGVEDQAHNEAVQVLARSGKLRELIERTEAQIALAPQSLQLYQLLATYQRAAGNKEKVKETIERMVQLRPDDARLTYQLAQQLYQSGDFATATRYFRTALEKEPALFGSRFSEVFNAYTRANQTADLVSLIEKLDLKSMGSSSAVVNVIYMLVMTNRGPANEHVMALFRKAWKAYPNERGLLLSRMNRDEFWTSPEILSYAREALIPGPASGPVATWLGFDQMISWGSDGRVTTVVSRVLEAASRQNKLDDLAQDVEHALDKHPEWAGGRALLALVRVRQRRLDDARRGVEALQADKKFPLPMEACSIIGQELENDDALRPLAVALYESTIKGPAVYSRYIGLGFQNRPARRLVMLYQREGRAGDARELLLSALRGRNDERFSSDPGYQAYRRINDMSFIAGELLTSGFPADAVRVYNDLLASPEDIQAAQRYFGNSDHITQQAEQGLRNSVDGLTPRTLAATLQTLLKPRDDRPDHTLDLVLLVNPRELKQAAVTSFFETALKSAADQPALLKEVKAKLEGLMKQYPEDLSVQTAAALAASAGGDAPALAEAAARLEDLVERRPLEVLSEGARPNARQRFEAARLLPLWPVARACSKQEAGRALGERLAARALEAAHRQSDPTWELAMYGELARTALKQGDRAAAEGQWSAMLARILANPAASPAPPALLTAGARPSHPRKLVPVLTLSRFGEAMQVAALAAENDMQSLSFRAVSDALKGGPPVVPISSSPVTRLVIRSISGIEELPDPVVQSVVRYVTELEKLWQRHNAPPGEVYEVLIAVVLPAARPNEIFLYTPMPSTRAVSLAGQVRNALVNSTSVGNRLASWAVRAGKADDLRRRIEERKANPGAKVAADVLLGQLASAEGNPTTTSEKRP
jgi:tetratricopeptide (TPR) repeat protein